MDYCLHNYFNYDVDKYNFRQVVLYALRNHVCCLHLRDTSTSRLSLYDVNDWLVDTKRDEEDLATAEENLKLAIEEKEALIKENISEKLPGITNINLDQYNDLYTPIYTFSLFYLFYYSK